MNEDYKLIAIDYHRNGVGGNGFHVVLFTSEEDHAGMFVATVFDELGSVAVLNVPLLTEGCIEFARGNSWRGDRFEPWLRAQISGWHTRIASELGVS